MSYSVEYLFHFKCSVCFQWWSIGCVGPDDHKGIEMRCPHCGNRERHKKSDLNRLAMSRD